MGLQGKETQIQARHHTDLASALDELVANLEAIEENQEGPIGATPRELAAKMGCSEGLAQRKLRAAVEDGRVECALGWRYSEVKKRNSRVYVYWVKKDEDEQPN